MLFTVNCPILILVMKIATKVWKHVIMNNAGEYHDLYLQTDVLLLADIFENFRTVCVEYYGLDPAQYYTLPNYAWDAMLEITDVELDEICDLDMYEIFENGLRGGMCQVGHKDVTANNKYAENDYNQDAVSSYIAYLDANNSYGLAMSQKLPYASFEWSDDVQPAEHVLIHNNGDEGYILEVDLEYPKDLHELHSDYPLAPENIKVSADMVSEFSKDIYKHDHDGKNVTNENTKKHNFQC